MADLIDRRATVDAIIRWLDDDDDDRSVFDVIKQIPPSQPEQRTGEYVHVSGYSDQYKCTACGIDIVPMRVVKFCPECGTKILKMTSGNRIRYPWKGVDK